MESFIVIRFNEEQVEGGMEKEFRQKVAMALADSANIISEMRHNAPALATVEILYWEAGMGNDEMWPGCERVYFLNPAAAKMCGDDLHIDLRAHQVIKGHELPEKHTTFVDLPYVIREYRLEQIE